MLRTKHPNCNPRRGSECCVHNDCPNGNRCCYHGSLEEPYAMNYLCGVCYQRFPRGFYLEDHMIKMH